MDQAEFLSTVPPWDALAPDELARLAAALRPRRFAAGERIHGPGEPPDGLHLVRRGRVELSDAAGAALSTLGPRDAFGERALMGDALAHAEATALEETVLLTLPAGRFHALAEAHPAVAAFFARPRPGRAAAHPPSLAETRVEALMSPDPATCPPGTTIGEAARIMRDRGISSLLVTGDGGLAGILTIRDISGRVVAGGMDPRAPVSEAMTPEPLTLPPDAIGSDVLHAMMERGVGHVPIVGAGGLVGIVTRTDLTRFQAESSAQIVGDAAHAPDAAALAAITARVPRLLAQLVGAGHRHEVVTRLITGVADAVTRRLLALAEAELGAPPAPYLWLACGSQGRQEQTGVSDQDNGLILSDAAAPAHDAYFAALARFVCGGLDRAGYAFCPGGMMAANPRWRQPVRVWRDTFAGWIATPDPMARMLASVMFDLRPIGGDASLHEGLQAETLAAAQRNSIFVAHMVSSSLHHAPPLSLFGGLATLKRGEHRRHIDLKMSGVVPVVDLGRIYALRGALAPVGTRARIEAARGRGVISEAGGRDLIDAYDLIAQTRLDHQAARVRAGEAPDNFLAPATLSAFERNHLRDAFAVVRTMQSAAAQGRGVP